MAQLSLQNEDVIATLQAQRNEAWDAAARAGAACAAAGRRIDELEKELVEAKARISDLEAGTGSGHD
jgi:predicted transcriptional regulator